MLKKSNRIFVDLQKIDQDMFCSICFEVFQDPCTLSCSHTFCYSCIVIERSIKRSCPICRNVEEIFELIKDVSLKSKINHLKTKCSHEGCEWTGRYYHLKKHQRLCEYRPEKVKKSSDCEVTNANRKNDVVEIDDDHIKGRKKVNIGQINNFQVSIFSFPALQKNKPLLLPPILQVVEYQRPVNGRFFDRATNISVPMISRTHGNRQNPLDLEDSSQKKT